MRFPIICVDLITKHSLHDTPTLATITRCEVPYYLCGPHHQTLSTWYTYPSLSNTMWGSLSSVWEDCGCLRRWWRRKCHGWEYDLLQPSSEHTQGFWMENKYCKKNITRLAIDLLSKQYVQWVDFLVYYIYNLNIY